MIEVQITESLCLVFAWYYIDNGYSSIIRSLANPSLKNIFSQTLSLYHLRFYLKHDRNKHFTTYIVKVWFQNRRTKHKRMQQEEEAKVQQNSSSNKNSHHVNKWKQETQNGSSSEHHDEMDRSYGSPYSRHMNSYDGCSSDEEDMVDCD
ncbi:uncharacterized protein LOC108253068 [Diaphorina citri]|uniref:Uncharacterized protein LOC108253068 n=1 Tax=Diaphorina citri TaxID=121845 RepID=A0A1S4EI85_DIACI|nr:uncharacterized protein LOC108253068 [Diaphorina citri]